MERRALLHWMVATGGLSAFTRLPLRDLLSLGAQAHQRGRPVGGGGHALGAQEMRTVAAAAECIIPRTDTPGATDALVSEFVDLMLADWYPPADVERFRAGVAALDAASQLRLGHAFAESSIDQQVGQVQELDTEVAALRRNAGTASNEHWFAMLKYLTVWGYCTSEVAMRETLRSYPRPMKYDGFAPLR